MLIVDGHLDMAYNALYHRRDLTQPVHTIREREDPFAASGPRHPDALPTRPGPDTAEAGTCTVTLPAMRKGHVGIMLSTVIARVQATGPVLHNAARTQLQAHARAQAHLAYYRALAREGEITFIHDVADLERVVLSWEEPASDTPIGLILSAESADPILSPDQVVA